MVRVATNHLYFIQFVQYNTENNNLLFSVREDTEPRNKRYVVY